MLKGPQNLYLVQYISKSLPAQHSVRLSCEYGRIHHKSCIVHNKCHSFPQSQSTAMPLFTAEVIHIDHIARSLSQGFGVVINSRRTQGPRHVSSNVGIGKRHPGRTWTGGSRGRASVTTFTVC